MGRKKDVNRAGDSKSEEEKDSFLCAIVNFQKRNTSPGAVKA